MTTTAIDPFASAATMLQALRERKVSAAELLELHLERIERYNPALNAIVTPNDKEARSAATAADDARARGEETPLLGLPITVKESIDVKGLRGTAGATESADRRAEPAPGPLGSASSRAPAGPDRPWHRPSSTTRMMPPSAGSEHSRRPGPRCG